jgi:hypothetical protein
MLIQIAYPKIFIFKSEVGSNMKLKLTILKCYNDIEQDKLPVRWSTGTRGEKNNNNNTT